MYNRHDTTTKQTWMATLSLTPTRMDSQFLKAGKGSLHLVSTGGLGCPIRLFRFNLILDCKITLLGNGLLLLIVLLKERNTRRLGNDSMPRCSEHLRLFSYDPWALSGPSLQLLCFAVHFFQPRDRYSLAHSAITERSPLFHVGSHLLLFFPPAFSASLRFPPLGCFWVFHASLYHFCVARKRGI